MQWSMIPRFHRGGLWLLHAPRAAQTLRDFGLLRARRERPSGRPAEQRDELTALHSMTLSARSRKLSGIVSPIAFAVFRLTINSNVVGNSTGRSAGRTPFRTLST